YEVLARAGIHHDPRHALLPQRRHAPSDGRLPAIHAGWRELQERVRLTARELQAVAQLRVLLGARARAHRPGDPHLDTLGPLDVRDRRETPSRGAERRPRPPA